MDKSSIYCYALGMLLNAAEDTAKELRRAGVKDPALNRLETTRRVVEILSNPRLEISFETPRQLSIFVDKLYENVRKEISA